MDQKLSGDNRNQERILFPGNQDRNPHIRSKIQSESTYSVKNAVGIHLFGQKQCISIQPEL